MEAPASIDILRTPEVTKALGVSKSTLYNWIQQGEFPPPRQIGPRAVGWTREEVESWIANCPRHDELGQTGDND